MSEDEQRRAEAAVRLRAAWHRMQGAKAELDLAALRTSAAMNSFTGCWVEAERATFEEHPDVQEVAAMTRGYYG